MPVLERADLDIRNVTHRRANSSGLKSGGKTSAPLQNSLECRRALSKLSSHPHFLAAAVLVRVLAGTSERERKGDGPRRRLQ